MFELRKCTLEDDIVESFPFDTQVEYDFIGLYQSVDGIIESIDDFSKAIEPLLLTAIDNLNKGETTLEDVRNSFGAYVF